MQRFPRGFLWGASTSAYQVEGGLYTQWSEWEQAQADKLTAEIPKRLGGVPGWQERFGAQAADPANYICGRGVEHHERYQQDFDILAGLHMNVFRFGVEWARLEPREGEWDEAAVEHYRRYIAALKKRGIEPVLTLWHWTMPVWFTNKGAFEKRSNLRHLERFAEKVLREFGAELQYLLTLNEPNVYTMLGYVTGEWPPQKKNPFLAVRVYRNLAEAHRRVYRMAKRAQPAVQVGLPMNLGEVRPLRPANPANRLAANIPAWVWNWWFLNMVRRCQDFIGVNYYFSDYRDWLGRVKNPPEPLNDIGWHMEPGRLVTVLQATWKRYRKPLLITENGLADAGDIRRQWWIQETLTALRAALDSGVDVRGYLHWSLLDNFEWAYGWWPEFGLVAVDRATMQRTVRPSARWFAEQITKLQQD